jgi:acetyltransferase-like isoleucine patch superfamily enzyme
MRRRRLLALYVLSRRVQTKILSLIACRGFARFGARSAIEPPLRVVGASRVSVGDDVFIGSGSWLQVIDAETGSGVAIEIGDGCEISGGLVISSAEKVVIGRKVLIAKNVYIADHRHAFGDPDHAILDQGIEGVAVVEICDGAWIGQGVVVGPGVRIGRGAVVGANAVVLDDVPDRAVAAGVPARIIRHIDDAAL